MELPHDVLRCFEPLSPGSNDWVPIETWSSVPLSRSKASGLQYKRGSPCQQMRLLGSSKHDSLLRLTRDKTTGCWTPVYLWKSRLTQLCSGKFGFLSFYKGINHSLTSSSTQTALPFSSALSHPYLFLLPLLPALLKLIVMGLPRTTPFWASSLFLADSGLLESCSSLITINYSYCPGYPVKHSLNSHYLCCF